MNTQVKRGLKKLLEWLAVAVVGLAVLKACEYWSEARKVTPRMLAEAAQDRSHLTDSSLGAAASIYRSLLSRTSGPEDSSRALAGLARTYADLATLRFWRGLSNGGYPAQARRYALHAMRIGHDTAGADIALAYAYASDEVGSETKPATKAKVGELAERHVDNLDMRYLAWVSDFNEASEAFPYRVQADS